MFKIYTQKVVSALQDDNKNLLDKCTGLENEINTLKGMSKDVMEEKAGHKAAVEKMQAEFNTQLSNLQTELSTLKAAKESAEKALIADYEKKLCDAKDTAKSELEKTISEMNAKLNTAECSSEAKAVKVLASIGVAAAELPAVTTKESAVSVLDKSRGLQGKELSNYYIKNMNSIRQALIDSKLKD